ncbi:MAG: protein glxC [Planctomycetaceae bacterium]
MERVKTFDLSRTTVRELNQFLHHDLAPRDDHKTAHVELVEVLHPDGAHSIAAGVNAPVCINIRGHAGYFVAGMNQLAEVTIFGNVGWSIAENMMSGRVHVKGHASESAGASAHGGLLVIDGDASSRCAISLKGGDIVVGGGVGHFSAFMAQAGTLVVCGDSGPNLGDSLYEAVIYVRGKIHSLGADAQEEPMGSADYETVGRLLKAAGMEYDPKDFKRVASARKLYHWNSEVHQEY